MNRTIEQWMEEGKRKQVDDICIVRSENITFIGQLLYFQTSTGLPESRLKSADEFRVYLENN